MSSSSTCTSGAPAPSTRWRRAVAPVVGVLALALAVFGSPAAATDPPITIAAHAAVPTVRVGVATSVVGHVTPVGALAHVIVQRLVGGAWVDRSPSTAVAADGSFRVPIRPSSVGRYDLRVRSSGGSVVSPAFVLEVVPPPSITLRAGASSAALGTALVLSGQVKPASATPRVVAQRLLDGRWVARGTASVGADGRFSITVRPSEVNRYRMRVTSAQGTIASGSVGFTSYTTEKVFDVFDTGMAKGQRVVALTFDDGPSPTYTPQVLDVLARHKVRGTFFVVGRSLATWPEPTRRAIREGHHIANHSWDHPELTKASDATVVSQIQRTQDQIAKVGGSSICVRPPYGDQNTRVRQIISNRMHESMILWNTDPGDWEGYSADTIVSRTLSQVRPGSIIVLHDGGSHRANTVAALDRLIPALKDRGYGFALIC